jgi:hypothetical protein
MIKRWFLWSESHRSLLFPSVMLLLAFFALLTVITIGFSFLPALIFLLLFTLTVIWLGTHLFILRRYIISIDPRMYDYDQTFIFKVKEGKVETVGKNFWKEDDYEYVFARLPRVAEGRFVCIVNLNYKNKEGKIDYEIQVNLLFAVPEDSATPLPNGFEPEEVYRLVLAKDNSDLREDIENEFRERITKSPSVQQKIRNHLKPWNFMIIRNVLEIVFQQMMSDYPLSNVTKVIVTLAKRDVFRQPFLGYLPETKEDSLV